MPLDGAWPHGADSVVLWESACTSAISVTTTTTFVWDCMTIPYDCNVVRAEAYFEVSSGLDSDDTVGVTISEHTDSGTNGVLSAATQTIVNALPLLNNAGSYASGDIKAASDSVIPVQLTIADAGPLIRGKFLRYSLVATRVAATIVITHLRVRLWVQPVYS